MKPYSRVLEEVLNIDRRGICLGLETIKRALKVLGHPEKSFPSILVAGTNGKGSVVAMLTAILRSSGYSVGQYTSPHITDIRERIELNGRPISQADFVRTASCLQTEMRTARLKLTFFEFMTAMAFLYFLDKRVDIAVVEVGLGGRLDATNILRPEVSIITTIDKDHQHFLGRTLRKIAFEKGGIIKRGIPTVLGVKQPRLSTYLRQIAHSKKSPVYCWDLDFFYERKRDQLIFQNERGSLKGLTLSLKGDHQYHNASLVLEAVDLLRQQGWKISQKNIKKGLSHTLWPGRCEVIRKNPQVILDAAHNPAGLKVLMKTLKKDFKYEKLHLVMGIMRDKNYRTMLKIASKEATRIHFIEPSLNRALRWNDLKRDRFMSPTLSKISYYPHLSEVHQTVLKQVSKRDLVCVTGSIFTISEYRKSL